MTIIRKQIWFLLFVYFMLGHVSWVFSGQVDLLDYGKIEVGMTEGEVLLRLGPPDLDSLDGYTWYNALQKTYYYFSEPERYQNITTVIHFTGGRVTHKERLYVQP
jgi:hypothetical protein